MRSRKVALFMAPLLTGGAGAEKYFIQFAANLRKRGIEADVITLDRKFHLIMCIFLSFFYIKKVSHKVKESEEVVNKNLNGAKWIKSSIGNLGKIISSYELIYAKNEILDLLFLKFVARYKKFPPIIVGVHTPILYPVSKSFHEKLHNFLYMGALYKWLIKDSRLIHVSNKFTKKIADSTFNIPARLVYYPFSSKDMQLIAEKNAYAHKFSKDKIKIVFISRFSNQKGIDELIRIIRKISLSDIKNRVEINIFGSGADKDVKKIKEISKKYKCVNYFGHAENRFIPSILMRQNLFITTAKWETLPYNVLEAQSMGVPAIAFDIPGPNDIIINNETGFLVRNEDEFFKKIEDFVKGKHVFMKEKIIGHVDATFNPEIIYSQLADMFYEIK